MFTLSSMSQIIAWFGWGNGIGAVAAISVILTLVVIVAPVIAGLLLYGLERAQVEIIGAVNRDFAYFFVNFLTFPGTFVHEMSHLCFAVITGAEVDEICMFESDGERLGHISYCTRGPWFMVAVQHDSHTSVSVPNGRWRPQWGALRSATFCSSTSLAAAIPCGNIAGSGTW